jgi:hypothetical protein
MVDHILPRESFQRWLPKEPSMTASRSSFPSFILKMRYTTTSITSMKSCIYGEKTICMTVLLTPIKNFFSSVNHTFKHTIVQPMWILTMKWWNRENLSRSLLLLQIGIFLLISLWLDLHDKPTVGNGWRCSCWVFCSFFSTD